MILAVNLNSTLDVVAPVDEFKAGEVLRTKNIYSYPGGKATNVARALATLGSDVFTTGFVSRRESGLMAGFLKKCRVKSSFVTVEGSNRICLLITQKKPVQETIINSESNYKITGSDISALLKKIKSLSQKASYAVLSGSLPMSIPENFYQAIIKSINKNCKVLLDTSSRYLFHGVKASPHIIKQNILELESAFGISLGDDFFSPSAKRKLKSFITAISKRYGIPVIIVTLGKNGSILYDKDAIIHYPVASAKKIVSPVGSGDAFTAGLVHGLSKSWQLDKALKLASACAAANLGSLGSCFFKKEDVKYSLETK